MTEQPKTIKGRVNKAVGGYFSILSKDLESYVDTIVTLQVVAVEPAPPRPPKTKKVTGEPPVGK